MKKILTVLCAAVLVAFAACSKDDDDAVQPTPAPQPAPAPEPPHEWPDEEGLFSPWAQIDTILTDGAVSEVWSWNGGRLEMVSDGNGDVQCQFTYGNDGRYNAIDVNSGLLSDYLGNMLTGTVTVSYNGDKIGGLTITHGATQLGTLALQRNSADKVSLATATLSDEALLSMLNDMIASYVGDNSSGFPQFTIDGSTAALYFSWVGSNVVRLLLNLSVNASTTRTAVVNSSLYGYLPSEVQTFLQSIFCPDNLNVQLSVHDTVSYDYDNQRNPLKHYLGQLAITTLSQNNVTSESHASGVVVKIGSGSFMFPLFSRPLLNATIGYDYLYNSAGYPYYVTTSRSADSGAATTSTTEYRYSYQQQEQ